jgi:hypothetical protein
MSGLSPVPLDGWIVRMKHLRAALHTAVDLVLDAIEADRTDAPEPAPVATKVRASRRGTALRMIGPTLDVSPEVLERAAAMARRKGI